MPSVEKNSAETSRPCKRSGSPAPVKLKLSFPRTAAIESKSRVLRTPINKVGIGGEKPLAREFVPE